MPAARGPGGGRPNRLNANERALRRQRPARHGGVGAAALFLGEGEIELTALREITGHQHVEQTALPLVFNVDRSHHTGAVTGGQKEDVAPLFGHHHLARRQEAKAPGRIEP